MMNNTIVNGKESLSMRHNRAPAFSRSILNSNYETTKTENPSIFNMNTYTCGTELILQTVWVQQINSCKDFVVDSLLLFVLADNSSPAGVSHSFHCGELQGVSRWLLTDGGFALKKKNCEYKCKFTFLSAYFSFLQPIVIIKHGHVLPSARGSAGSVRRRDEVYAHLQNSVRRDHHHLLWYFTQNQLCF